MSANHLNVFRADRSRPAITPFNSKVWERKGFIEYSTNVLIRERLLSYIIANPFLDIPCRKFIPGVVYFKQYVIVLTMCEVFNNWSSLVSVCDYSNLISLLFKKFEKFV